VFRVISTFLHFPVRNINSVPGHSCSGTLIPVLGNHECYTFKIGFPDRVHKKGEKACCDLEGGLRIPVEG